MRSENMKQFQLGCVHQLGFVDQDVLAELRVPNPRFQEWLVKTLGQRDSDVKNFSVATQHASARIFIWHLVFPYLHVTACWQGRRKTFQPRVKLLPCR